VEFLFFILSGVPIFPSSFFSACGACPYPMRSNQIGRFEKIYACCANTLVNPLSSPAFALGRCRLFFLLHFFLVSLNQAFLVLQNLTLGGMAIILLPFAFLSLRGIFSPPPFASCFPPPYRRVPLPHPSPLTYQESTSNLSLPLFVHSTNVPSLSFWLFSHKPQV